MEKDRNTGFDNRPSISLMFSFIDIKIYPLPSLPSPSLSPLNQLGVWGSAVSSPSGVRGGARAENEFNAH